MRFVLPIVLAIAFALPLHAEEPNGEDTAAARLFREGWWLETGAGALDKASAKYEAAVAAEGSSKIRARALYRLGVVLQRMGRTEEGIKALERLGKEFASETTLLAEAQQRLEEWTGADLRESFGEWYRRYQYSPEFQAKVIDLVLKLGMGHVDYKARNAAEQELLTIGEPAIPALRAHAASTNTMLATAASKLLFRLGSVPPPASLVLATQWASRSANVERVLEGDEATRLAIRQGLAGDDRLGARMLRAAATGRLDVVHEFLAQDKTTRPQLGELLRWGMDTDVPADLLARVKALVADGDAEFRRRMEAIGAFNAERGQVTAAELHTWARSGHENVRDAALHAAAREGVDRSDLWRVYVELIQGTQGNVRELEHWTKTLLFALRHAPEQVDLAPAREALASRLDWSYVLQSLRYNVSYAYKDNPHARALLASLIETGTGSGVSSLLKTHVQIHDPASKTSLPMQLLGWSTTVKEPRARLRAMEEAARLWTGDPDGLLAPLAAGRSREELRSAVFTGLAKQADPSDLAWTRETVRGLVDIASGFPKTQVRTTSGTSRPQLVSLPGPANHVLYRMFERERTRELLLGMMRESPEAMPWAVATRLAPARARTSDGTPIGIAILRSSWSKWTTDEQRLAGLGLCTTPLLSQSETALVEAFALEQLERGRGANSTTVRNALMKRVSKEKRTLKAIQAAFDLTDDEQFQAAVFEQLRYLPRDAATYDAFARALDKDVPAPIAASFNAHFAAQLSEGFPLADRRREHIRRCLARGDEEGARIAIRHLGAKRSIEDMALWHALLRHESRIIRIQVAQQLGSFYTKETIGELARLVDDPDPGVRDAALESLERIKKIEEQKDYWRKFAK